MMEKLSRSWGLVKASAGVLQADRELLLFPVISSACLIAVGITFLVPLAFLHLGGEGSSLQAVGYVVLFAFYVVSYFVMIFFNTALVGAAMIRLEGGDPTLADGLGIARDRVGAIFGYAVIAATVGLILRAARERGGFLVKLLVALGGLAWSLATFLVVPVLAARDIGPIDAIKESTALLKKTWGEQIAGNVGISLVFGLVTVLFTIAVIPVIALAAMSGSLPVIITAVVVVVLGYVALALVSTTLSAIYSAALYRFATTGEASIFDEGTLRGAFRPT